MSLLPFSISTRLEYNQYSISKRYLCSWLCGSVNIISNVKCWSKWSKFNSVIFIYICLYCFKTFFYYFFFPGGAGGREAQLDQESLVGLLRHDQVRDWLQPAGVQGLRLLLWLSWIRQHCGWYWQVKILFRQNIIQSSPPLWLSRCPERIFFFVINCFVYYIVTFFVLTIQFDNHYFYSNGTHCNKSNPISSVEVLQDAW